MKTLQTGKELQYGLVAKTAAVILFVLMVILSVGSSVGIVYMAREGYYINGFSFYDTSTCRDITEGNANTVFYSYYLKSAKSIKTAEDLVAIKEYDKRFLTDNSNLCFTIVNYDGVEVFSNYSEQEFGLQRSYHYNNFIVNIYVKNPITAKDNYYASYQICNMLYSLRYILIVIAVLSAAAAVALLIFMLHAAGRRKGHEGIVLNGQDKVPFDLYLLVTVMVPIYGMLYLNTNLFYTLTTLQQIIAGSTLALIALLLVLALLITFAARAKAGKWWQNTVIYRVLKLLYKGLRFMGRILGTLFANLPVIWKVGLGFLGYLLINAVLLYGCSETVRLPVPLFLLLMFNFDTLVGLCYIALLMHRLKKGGERMAAGDYRQKIDTRYMVWDFKAHAETLNNIGGGMSAAVEERLKSERLKTELITNVSHDIKTPLTSIVNYVDLLKKEQIDNENAQKYLEVLDRQSARMKKLIEDLVEASKASTGNIAVNAVQTNLVELLNQSLGEYAERFEQCGLVPVLRTPQNDIVVLADGRLLWRVFDNVLNNICKYSLQGTRVYLDIALNDKQVTVSFKNISNYPLNVSADELLERFVRGDSARTTEGSGLGLAIAKSLTELQNGRFDLSVDGDLFKVTVTFERIDHAQNG